MPLYNFSCRSCNKTKRKIFTVEQYEGDIVICDCGEVMFRMNIPMTTQVVETLDNGISPRKLERLADAQRLFHDRANKKIDE